MGLLTEREHVIHEQLADHISTNKFYNNNHHSSKLAMTCANSTQIFMKH